MDNLKNILDQIEKAESILKELERKQDRELPGKSAASKLDKEQQDIIDSAKRALRAIKGKLSQELTHHKLELDKRKEDLTLLQARHQIGEISEGESQTRSKHITDRIMALEKKITDIQSLIDSKFATDIAPLIEAGQDVLFSESEQHITDESKLSATEEAVTDVQDKVESSASHLTVHEPDAVSETSAETEAAGNEKNEESEREAASVKSHKPALNPDHPNEPPRKKGAVQGSTIPRRKRTLWIAVIAIVAVLLLASGILFLIPRTGSDIGNKAPDFAIQLNSENMSTLSAFHGTSVILVFWDRDFWDEQFFYINGIARKLYTPDKLNQLYREMPRSELTIIAIASGTTNSEIDKLVSDYNIEFPVIVDSLGKLRTSYNIKEEPTYIFIDKSGVIRTRGEGPITDLSSLEQVVYSISKNAQVKPIKPPITDVIIQAITEKSAIINWTTSTPTTTQVDIDGKNIQTVITPAPTTLHSLVLRDLEPATSYHIRILYNINNINVSEHSFSALAETIVSRRYVLTTSSQDTSYPDISGISTGFITDSSFTVSWKTDEPTTGEVDYGTDREYRDTASQGSKMSIWHTVKIEGLQPDTLYYLRLRSRDASGKETVQELGTIKTQSAIEIGPVVGKRAPDFTLYALDGTKFTLSQFRGKRIWLNFWLEGCPPCETEMPLIQKAFDKYNRDELIILAVNIRGDVDKVSYYIGTQKFTFPVLLDTNGDVDSIYRAPFFPTSYFIDSTGIIRHIESQSFQSLAEVDDIISKLE